MADRTVRIAVIGDEGVGKSSLVLAAVHNTFTDNPVPTLPPTRLPADTVESYISPAPATLIVDTCSSPEDKQAWELNVQQAHAIVLTFAANDYNSLRRVVMHWIPELERVGARRPIILSACKCDLGDIREERFQSLIQAILLEYRHIETFLESSAKKQQSIPDIFYYAVKSVVHPAEPLVEFITGQLKPLCVKALKRIFLLCDINADGALNDEELNRFQIKCFHAPLQPTELAGVKEVVGERLPGGLNEHGLTLKGFLFLHALFIEKARTETVWTVLRSFGYSDELLIEQKLLDSVDFSHQPDQSVEVSSDGKRLLRRLFTSFDVNEDGLLSDAEQNEMFSASPSSPLEDANLMGIMVQSSDQGFTQKGFASCWAYLAIVNPSKALEHMMYLGLPMDPALMQRQFAISKTRQQERRRGKDFQGRALFQCFVFGAANAGKSSLLQGLVRKHGQPGSNKSEPKEEEGNAGQAPAANIAVNEIPVARGNRQREVMTTLVLREMQEEQIQSFEEDPQALQDECDVAAFVFDGSNIESFKAAQDLLLKLAQLADDTIPCVLIAAKDDLGISMDIQDECGRVAQELRMQVPLQVSSQTDDASPVFSALVTAALTATKFIPETPTLRAKRRSEQASRRTASFIAVSALVVAGVYATYRWSHNSASVTEISRSGDSKDTVASGDRNQTKGGASDVRRDMQAYVKGLFSGWSRS